MPPRRPSPRGPRKPGQRTTGRRPTGKPAHGRHPQAGKPRQPWRKPVTTERISPQSGERLQKVLAAAGIASRREAEQLILEGRVEVDGQVVQELGTRVDPAKQAIFVDGERLSQPKLVYFAVNKPVGVVCTARDPAGRPRVTDLLPPDVGRVFNVGRLDLNSEGLILVTNDGELANQLTHPRHGVHKVYEVQVAGQPLPEVLGQLRRGMHLAEGFARAVDVRVKARRKGSTLLEMVLDEGRNREVRRMFARLGHKVQRLTRIAVGPVRLGEMPPGSWRPLTREEVRKLREVVSRPYSPKPGPPRPRKPAEGSAPRPAGGYQGKKRENEPPKPRPTRNQGGPRKPGKTSARRPTSTKRTPRKGGQR